jgi:hypothetical protein
MKKLPIGIQTFEIMAAEGYVYVDKTKHIYDLITRGRYYFLSRPRRFGKSLLISTLKDIFLGNKDLFKDLWIYTSSYDWSKHPVIHLDFSEVAHATSEQLAADLSWNLDILAKEYGLDTTSAPSAQAKLKMLVRYLAKKHIPHRVVILIDEYDYPILNHLHNTEVAKAHQALLRSFYAAIKSLNAYLEFVFVTGVSKFSRTSIFSGLNNLKDITNTSQGASLLGYTEEELAYYFKDHIQNIAKKQKSSFDKIIEQMQSWYNGYRFSREPLNVYNPYSVLLYLDSGFIENYWFETGTPSFLISILRNKRSSLKNITQGRVSVSSLGTFSIENIPLITLLFQTGYLTIKDYKPKTRKYKLGMPNKEVELSFEKNLLSAFTYLDEPDVESTLEQIREALEHNRIQEFCIQLKSLFANIPYQLHLEEEKYYHSLFQFMGSLLGMDAQSEVSTNRGRIDLTLITKKYIYLFEFKFNQDAAKALRQIESKKYYEKYLGQEKRIILVGISFNRNQKEFALEYVAKPLSISALTS